MGWYYNGAVGLRRNGKYVEHNFRHVEIGKNPHNKECSQNYFMMEVNLENKNIFFYGSGIAQIKNRTFGFKISDKIYNSKPFKLTISYQSKFRNGIGLGLVKMQESVMGDMPRVFHE